MLNESQQDSIQPQPRRTPLVTIFNGERYDLGEGTSPEYYVQLSVLFRDYMHFFGEALPTFLQIALRINKGGWSYPTVPLIAKGSGQSTDTIALHLNFLCGLEIPGYGRVLLRINKKELSPEGKATGKFGNNRYKVFPTAQDIADNKQFERPARLRKRQAKKIENIISFPFEYPFEYQKPDAEISKIENSQNEKIAGSSSNSEPSENNKQHDMPTITTLTVPVQVATKNSLPLRTNKEESKDSCISNEIHGIFKINESEEKNPLQEEIGSIEANTEDLPKIKNGKGIVVIPPLSEKVISLKARLKNPETPLSEVVEIKKRIADDRTTELLAFLDLAKLNKQVVVATEAELYREDRKLVNELTVMTWMIQSLYGTKFPIDIVHLARIKSLSRSAFRLKSVILDKYNPQVVGNPLKWINSCVLWKNDAGNIENVPISKFSKVAKQLSGKSGPNPFLKPRDGEIYQNQLARLKGLIESNDFLDSWESARQKLDALEAVEVLEKKLNSTDSTDKKVS